METDLTWNNSRGYYEGEFATTAGLWKFDRVEIPNGVNDQGDTLYNTIRIASAGAPVFTLIPPEPPSYNSIIADTRQYLPEGESAKLSVTLKDAGAATVFAKLVKVDDNGNPVAGVSPIYQQAIKGDPTTMTVNGVDVTYTPYTVNLDVGGLWRMEEVSAFDAVDKNKVHHPIPENGVTDDTSFRKGIVFNAETTRGEENQYAPPTVAVLRQNDISVSLMYAADVFPYQTEMADGTKVGAFGKDSSGKITALFMDSHQLSSGKITMILNDSNNLIRDGYFPISNVSLDYVYGSNNGNTAYGGYSSNNTSISEGKIFKNMAFNGSGMNFSLAESVVFQYATQYKPASVYFDISYEYNGATKTEAATNITPLRGGYNIEVYSLAPELKWTAVNPDVNTTIYYINQDPKTTYDYGLGALFTDDVKVSESVRKSTKNTISSDQYTATVYFQGKLKSESGCDGSGTKYYVDGGGFTASKATLAISRIANVAFNCSVTFAGKTISYGEGSFSNSATFSFSNSSRTSTQTIGKTQVMGSLSNKIARVPVYQAPEISQITITCNDVTYTVTLDHAVKLVNNY